MANLAHGTLDADDCSQMILSMWFQIPEELPTQEDNPTATDNPTAETDESQVFHTYILMEWGNYQQVWHKRYKATTWIVDTVLGYPDTLPDFDPRYDWQDLTPNDSTHIFVYNAPINAVYDIDGAAQNVDPQYFPPPPVDIYGINLKLGYYRYNPGGDTEDPGTWTNFTGVGDTIGYGKQFPLTLTGYKVGAPFFNVFSDGNTSRVDSEVIRLGWEDMGGKYYNYTKPSTISISGTKDTLILKVHIGGAIFGPIRATTRQISIYGPPVPYPGYTVRPWFEMTAPGYGSPFVPEDAPSIGSDAMPYVTRGKWHHLLVCVDIGGENMVERFAVPNVPEPDNEGSRYTGLGKMWVLLDGVKYGNDPFPAPLPEDQQFAPYPLIQGPEGIHEGPYAEYVFGDVGSWAPLQDTSFDSRHGILVKGETLSIPYHKQWQRTDPQEYVTEYADWNKQTVTEQGLAANHTTYSYLMGWAGGDPELTVTGSLWGPFGEDINWITTVPAAQQDPSEVITGDEAATIFPARTIDIERKYAEVQIWFGKYIDPTKYENLKLFLDIFRDEDDHKLYGNIPALDDAARAAYAAAQADDPELKILSLAAAPNHLGTPDVYLAGGASSFIHDRGEEGDNMVKIGTINNTSRPSDIPIPESAVKPPGL